VKREATRKSALSGLLWSVIDLGGGQILSFLSFLVLARILVPEEYGTFALAGTFTAFAFFLLQGLTPAVVQRGSITADHALTAFWTSVAIGAGCALILAASAGVLASLFQHPQLAPVLRCLSLVCLPMSLASVPMALFRRELQMSKFAVRTVAGYVVGGAVSIVMALNGFGALALAFGQIAQWSTVVVVVYAVSSWRPQFRFSMPIFIELGRYSIHYIAASAAAFITSKADMWILGAFLDPRSLGYYALALRLLEAVSTATIWPVLLISVPLLSPLRSDRKEFNAQYQHLVIGATSAWLPAVAGIGVVAAKLIPLALGEQWVGSVPVIQAMCLSAFTFSVVALTGEAMSAWGRPDVFSKLELLRLVVTTAAFGVAAQFGTVAAGFAWAIVPAVVLPVHLLTLRRISRVHVVGLLREWSKVAASGLFMVATIVVIDRFGPFGQWLPGVEIAIGAAGYLLLLDRVMLPGSVSQLVRLSLGSVPAVASQVKR
jgi:O-antigen/teichoic acid export membrane protein